LVNPRIVFHGSAAIRINARTPQYYCIFRALFAPLNHIASSFINPLFI